MAAAERITFADFQERFKTEEQCQAYLFRQRFPNGFVCPSCGAKEYYPVYRRNLCQCKIRCASSNCLLKMSNKSRITSAFVSVSLNNQIVFASGT